MGWLKGQRQHGKAWLLKLVALMDSKTRKPTRATFLVPEVKIRSSPAARPEAPRPFLIPTELFDSTEFSSSFLPPTELEQLISMFGGSFVSCLIMFVQLHLVLYGILTLDYVVGGSYIQPSLKIADAEEQSFWESA